MLPFVVAFWVLYISFCFRSGGLKEGCCWTTLIPTYRNGNTFLLSFVEGRVSDVWRGGFLMSLSFYLHGYVDGQRMHAFIMVDGM